ncbi:Response regulator PleD [Aliarcobacter thereius]|uniref:GGDEF domain-containing protein n=1 Tax=Aliarcobacter thereius TaxID=544718 RepID=UPI0008289CAB|nr:GGDEF domain-containing protein [Aliarcobacter thereius]OCL87612.1 Response regulator PleD [Aliarcobacter thereius]
MDSYILNYQKEILIVVLFIFIMIYLYSKIKYINKIEHINKELILISSIDYLTKINNRKSIDYFLNENIKFFERYKENFSIIMIDIDRFKNVNDIFGHLIGDNILIEFSELIKKNIREIDILGRFGGEEFIIICRKTQIDGALKLSEELRKKVAKHNFLVVGNITASFGVANFSSKDNIYTLLKKADTALYLAKTNGRNKVELIR